MPEKLYLQREFCGLEPGAEFRLVASHPSDKLVMRYTHESEGVGVFVIPSDAALCYDEWFGEEKPGEADGNRELGAEEGAGG